MATGLDCGDCHNLSAPTNIETINAACMGCHDDEEERFKDMLSTWDREVARLLTDAERRVQDDRGRRLLEALRKSGPLHNIEAIRAAVGSLGGEPAAPGAAQESP
jgi:formate-dependent nitrite reductase cytochrome c552 subunit